MTSRSNGKKSQQSYGHRVLYHTNKSVGSNEAIKDKDDLEYMLGTNEAVEQWESPNAKMKLYSYV